MIDGISVVWLPVSDMDKALEFYGDTLGLDIEQQEDDWSLVVAGAVRIGLNGRDEEHSGGEGGAVIAFAVSDDIEAAVDELKARGRRDRRRRHPSTPGGRSPPSSTRTATSCSSTKVTNEARILRDVAYAFEFSGLSRHHS